MLQQVSITVTLDGKQVEPQITHVTGSLYESAKSIKEAFGLTTPQPGWATEWSVFIGGRYIGSSQLLDRNALKTYSSLLSKQSDPTVVDWNLIDHSTHHDHPTGAAADNNVLHLSTWNYSSARVIKPEYQLAVGFIANADIPSLRKEIITKLGLETRGLPNRCQWQFVYLGSQPIGYRYFEGNTAPFGDVYNAVEDILARQHDQEIIPLTTDQLTQRHVTAMNDAMKKMYTVHIPPQTPQYEIFISYPWDPDEGVHFKTVKPFGYIQERLRRRLRAVYADDTSRRSPIHFRCRDGGLTWTSTRYLSLRGNAVEIHQIKSVYADVVAELSIPNTPQFRNEPGWAYGYEQPPAGMLPHIEYIAVVQSPQGTKMAWVATQAKGEKDKAAINTFLSTVLPPGYDATAIYHISREERKPYHWYGHIDGDVAYRVIMGETYGVVLDWDDELLSRQDVETIFYVWGL